MLVANHSGNLSGRVESARVSAAFLLRFSWVTSQRVEDYAR